MRPRHASPQLHHIIADVETHAVLAASSGIATVSAVSKIVPDTYAALWTGHPNYPDAPFLSGIAPEDYPAWSWVHSKRTFRPTRPDLITDALRSRAALTRAKVGAAETIIRNINAIREKSVSGITLQEYVYLEKRYEAEAFKREGYDEERLVAYPFVLQYAEFRDCTGRQAADEILLKAKIYNEQLSKSELLRLRYFAKLAAITEPGGIAALLEEFNNEAYVNARA